MGEVIWLTVRLAGVTTLLLLLLSTPLAWWLARSPSRWTAVVGAVVGLPLVLPPTVLGFYLLLALGPYSLFMAPLAPFGVRTLAFTFTGLVIGSLIYSLPFAVQPLRNVFVAIGDEPLESAVALGARAPTLFTPVALAPAAPGYAAPFPARRRWSPPRSSAWWRAWPGKRPTVWPPCWWRSALR